MVGTMFPEYGLSKTPLNRPPSFGFEDETSGLPSNRLGGFGVAPPQAPSAPVKFDPYGQAQAFWQPQFNPSLDPKGGALNRLMSLTTGAPQRLDEFRRFAEPLIGEQFRGSLLEQLTTMLGQQRTNERQQMDQLSQLGVSPAAVLGRLLPEQRQASAEQQGGLRGAAIAGEAGARQDLASQLLSAMNQIEAFQDSLRLQEYLASKGRSAARQGAKSAQTASLIGGGLGALGMFGLGGGFGGGAGLTPAQAGGINTATSFNAQQLTSLLSSLFS